MNKSKFPKNIHSEISRYVEGNIRTYIGGNIMYSSYNSPNTTSSVSDMLWPLLEVIEPISIKMYARSVSLLRRNPDPILACSISLHYDLYKDLMSSKSYYRAKAELIQCRLIIATSSSKLFIVNIQYTNKLYKPKLDIE
jgi:hypothetical protein